MGNDGLLQPKGFVEIRIEKDYSKTCATRGQTKINNEIPNRWQEFRGIRNLK
jgi:hypothetical protein